MIICPASIEMGSGITKVFPFFVYRFAEKALTRFLTASSFRFSPDIDS